MEHGYFSRKGRTSWRLDGVLAVGFQRRMRPWNQKHPILLFHVAVAIPAQSKVLSGSKIEAHILSTSLPFIRASYEEMESSREFLQTNNPSQYENLS